MLKLIEKIFGSKHVKDVKALQPLVDETNEFYAEFESLSDEELKAKTDEFKGIIKENTKEIDDELAELYSKLRNEALTAADTGAVNDRIEELENELFEVVQSVLDDLLTEAFAVVKQACKRLKESGHKFEYAGQTSLWEMVPYDVQLVGGMVLHQGKISEMATGEGKTLVAILPIYLNSLAGKGVHLVTVNDYLAKRDSDWMRPVYEYLGLSVGAIQSNMDNAKRKKMYNCDITYGTNNEFGFDYLRDNMVVEQDHMVQRGHWYAIVDEVDSVLIDEARTPLIISGPVAQSDQRFDEMNPRVKRLVDAQTRMINGIVSDANKLISEDVAKNRDEIGVKLLSAHRGLPKHKRFNKILQDPDMLKLLQETELFFLRDQGRKMHEIDDELYYTIDQKNHNIDLTEKGVDLITSSQEDPDLFVIPDIATELSEIEGDEEISDEEKQKKIDAVNLLYAERSDRIHTVTQLLRAYSLYEKDVEYVVQDGKVMIVDEFTGRILDGRRYSEGLHQAIEAKEHVKVERDTQTLATITLQNYFRLYKKLAGMTGTAETEAAEFEKIYDLEVTVVPTNKPIVRDDMEDLIYKTTREKYNAIANHIKEVLAEGRAVLVGTASVEVSEVISKLLTRQGIKHNVLNAKHHRREAEIVANAGKKGALTIATNMAGRGTDIKLDAEVKKNGGLAIIGSERHDARRIDRQLRGRAGRQGDPGSSQFFISLEDKLMKLFGGEKIAGAMRTLKIPEGEPIQHKIITNAVERAQKKVEENNFGIRKRLLEYDDVMNQQRTVIYERRKHALRGERMKGELFDYIDRLADQWYDAFHPESNATELKKAVRANLLCDLKITEDQFKDMGKQECVELILKEANEFYKRKEEALGSEFMGRLERIAVLQTIDEKWRDHLRVMDDLKEGIHLRAYGQKDPLLEYKGEAFKIFIDLIQDINRESVNFAFKYFPQIVERQVKVKPGQKTAADKEKKDGALPSMRTRSVSTQSMSFEHSSATPDFVQAPQQGGQIPQQQQPEGMATTVKTSRRTSKKIGRNDPCPCGSGKKYKKCCGRNA